MGVVGLAVAGGVVGVLGGVDLGVVGIAAARGHHGEGFAEGGGGDVGVRCADGAALGAVRGGGVPELDVLAHIVSGAAPQLRPRSRG